MLANGNATTVTITINGVGGAGDRLGGNAGNNTISGTAAADYFDLSQGGNDTANGGASDDAFFFGGAFTALDTVDGGAGTNDQVGLQGDYATTPLVLGPGQLVNIEALAVLPGFSYNITSNDGNVAPGQELAIFGGNLLAGQNFTFNGSAETDGRFRMFGGLGNDTFTGGALDDGFYFGPGKWGAGDTVVGGGGTNDQLALDGNYTTTIGANAGVETLILLPGPVASQNTFAITLSNAWTTAAATKTIWGLNVTTDMTINGSAELDGNLIIYGGKGSDTIRGGGGADILYGGEGGDTLVGGGSFGAKDVFRYDSVTESFGTTAATRDTVTFDGNQKFDLSRIDANTTNGSGDDAFSFIGSAAFSNVAGQLRYSGANLIEGDVDGNGIADFAIFVNASASIVATDFVL